MKHGVDCGGWCPAGRLDEFGKIPDHYPLKEMEHGSFAARTFQNVRDSDGTAIIFYGQLSGGTAQTVTFCENEKRPHLLIDATKTSAEEAAQLIRKFVQERNVAALNIAGPRQSEWTEGYDYAFRAIDHFLSFL